MLNKAIRAVYGLSLMKYCVPSDTDRIRFNPTKDGLMAATWYSDCLSWNEAVSVIKRLYNPIKIKIVDSYQWATTSYPYGFKYEILFEESDHE